VIGKNEKDGKGNGKGCPTAGQQRGPGVLKTDHHKELKKVPLREEGE
jgi:hypothetical protein